jgi:hypothetical protein
MLPTWITDLRRKRIVDVVSADPRSRGNLVLGVERERVFREVIDGGQADFDADWRDHQTGTTLSGTDRALLYGYFNLEGHLSELVAGLGMLTRQATRLNNPVVLDLGCGPGTGVLAMAHALGPNSPFTYIGVDRAASMRELGESLAQGAQSYGYLQSIPRIWTATAEPAVWRDPPGWRPVLIIASYLLASPTIDVRGMFSATLSLVDSVGRGPVIVLYTNSIKPGPNARFALLERILLEKGFSLYAAEEGAVPHRGGSRSLRYALFYRGQRDTLALE